MLTGIPFYALGLVLLALGSARARRWVNGLEARLPERFRRRLRRLLARVPGSRLRKTMNLPPEPP